MSAPIVTSRVIPYQIPVHVPFAIATQTLPQAEGAFIEITSEDARTGLGEAAPFPVLTKDDAKTCIAHATDLLFEIKGLSARDALARLATMRRESFSISRTAYVGVESALWDLLAKDRGLPLANIWGQGALTSLTTDITLPIMATGQIPAFWQRFGSYGFDVVKIKVSGHVSSDLDLVTHTVRLLGPKVRITLDGNQGFSERNAEALVAQLLRVGIKPDFFEQPLPADDDQGLAALTAHLPIPVCVDETVVTREDAIRVAQDQLGHIINLKIMKSGIDETLAIIAIAQKSGLSLMIGGMLETEVAMGVSLQLACGTGAVTHVDLDTPFFMTSPSTLHSPWAGRSARLLCPMEPGHGLRLTP